jgi:general secretion pathway protein N
MKKWLGYGSSFLGLYLFFVISAIPATFALSFVEVPKDISIENVTGTLWNTKVEQVTHQDITLNKVNASVNFWSLFTLDPSVDLSFGSAIIPGPEGSLTLSGFTSVLAIHDAEILIPANQIVKKLPLPIEVIAGNDIRILVDEFVLGKPICELASAEIQWEKASMQAMNEKVILGDLSALVSCDKGAIEVTIAPDNDLGLSLVVYVNQKGISGGGELQPGDKFPQPLKAALPFLGQADNKGRYRLNF